MHSNVIIKNVSWPHFSWRTLYLLTRLLACHCVGWRELVRDKSLYKRCYMTQGVDRVCFSTYGRRLDLIGAAQFCLKLGMTPPIISQDTDVRYDNRPLFDRYIQSSPASVRNARVWLGLLKKKWTAEWSRLDGTGGQLILSPANVTGYLSFSDMRVRRLNKLDSTR